jgi:hypothetical protein
MPEKFFIHSYLLSPASTAGEFLICIKFFHTLSKMNLIGSIVLPGRILQVLLLNFSAKYE